MEESPVYTLHKASSYYVHTLSRALCSFILVQENCWFFCSVTVDLLVKKFSGEFEDGYTLEHAKSAPKEREAIRSKWLAMK